jgi:hypothetical protein
MEKTSSSEHTAEEVAALSQLAEREIKRIKQLPQPVVRVCGPLTCDGPEGYTRSASRLTEAEKILQKKGMTVWTFGEAEEEIFGKGYANENIFEYFHKPILKSGLIKKAYFLPRWEESIGATSERNIATEAGVAIIEFPEKWF